MQLHRFFILREFVFSLCFRQLQCEIQTKQTLLCWIQIEPIREVERAIWSSYLSYLSASFIVTNAHPKRTHPTIVVVIADNEIRGPRRGWEDESFGRSLIFCLRWLKVWKFVNFGVGVSVITRTPPKIQSKWIDFILNLKKLVDNRYN